MKAGKLRHRVTIQRVTETLDSFGQPTLTWAKLHDRWAAVEPLSGRELFNAQKVSPDVTHQITLRYLDGLTSKDRIIHDSRTLEILEPPRTTDDRKIDHIVLCRELA